VVEFPTSAAKAALLGLTSGTTEVVPFPVVSFLDG
jgi:hypothetical protein